MQHKARNYYNSNIKTLESGLKKIRKLFLYLYLMRLVTFISFAVFLVLYFLNGYYSLHIIFSLASLALFLYAVKIDLNYLNKEKFLSNKLVINQTELKFLEHQYDGRQTGIEYIDLNPHLAADFDLFGKGSLFQYLNRCSTGIGKRKLAEGLCQFEKNEKLIKVRQLAVQELSQKKEFIHDFQAYGWFITENGNELTSLQTWLNQPSVKNRWLIFFRIILSLVNFAWIIFIMFNVFTITSVIIPILIDFIILSFNLKEINKSHSLLDKTAHTFKKYTALIKLTEKEKFESYHLSEIKKLLFSNGIKASDSLTLLYKLLNYFDLRFNIFISLIANSLFLFDIQIYYRLAKWKEKHKDVVSLWFDALSEIDRSISLSVFAFNNQETISYPRISDKEFTFQAEELGHPLLHPSLRISNDFSFSGTPSVIIITGANMAGKSTFLRTLSVNLILAMNGAPVCAKEFLFTPCDIMSSITIQDSLSNNESYFYAELLRIKDIIEHVKAIPRTFVVLDEILRGTNTKDKELGTLGLLEKLISLNSIVIIATHNLTIGEMEKKYPEIVVNHCFEVELTNDQLIFDYKLKKGISQKLNASFLMKKLGIIG
jgi:hypothetical protein